mmetsp:Transcript_20954/g.42599  ORF Transcript_20954/g.42599 Transcript_20954/m.42599 type:complete len:163 (+) Transcript_20954:413-901(+)
MLPWKRLIPPWSQETFRKPLLCRAPLSSMGADTSTIPFFWENLCPNSSSCFPTGGPLEAAVNDRFGSLDDMIAEMSAKTIAVQGSGWGWLVYDPKSKMIDVVALPNQDPLEASTGLKPLLGIDVWEHAYYVDYRNVRPNYVKAIWDIINWDVVEQRLAEASK